MPLLIRNTWGSISINSKYFPNALMKKVLPNNQNPHLCLFALKEIKHNEEIVYF